MLQGLPDDDWILRPDVADGVKAMVAHGLRFDALVFPRHLPVMAKFFARYPDLAVVIDHGAKPHIARGEIASWKAQMRALAREFPVMCKLSGLATEAAPGWSGETLRPYVEALIEIFGPSRLMWGSDWPVLNMAGTYPGWFAMARELTVQLSEADRDAIFGGTAARFYGL
jgi:L-fuconolactonase